MKRSFLILTVLFAAVALAGCEHPYARVATLQDPKYPVAHDSKIALPDFESPATDLANRLAGEAIEEQMRAMGFHLTPPADADFQLSFTTADKDVSQSYTVSVPTISNMVGTAGGRPVSGTVFGNDVVPQTRTVSMTQLEIWLQRTHEPKVEVWRGRIAAEASDVRQFQAAFFRALLENIGASANGAVQLDADKTPAK